MLLVSCRSLDDVIAELLKSSSWSKQEIRDLISTLSLHPASRSTAFANFVHQVSTSPTLFFDLVTEI